MKLDFEIWCENNNINGDALNLFNESILCYKIGAYKAALILSYLGFQISLKEKILNADPDKLEKKIKGTWHTYKEDLKNPDIWDKTVSEIVSKQKEENIFLISDDLKRQHSYWKDRRNDCAHAKHNNINYSVVETFWLFIKANYYKFTVNGGKAGLLDKLKVHFDRSLTEPGKDIGYIVNNITSSIDNSDIIDFFNEVEDLFSKKYNIFGSKYKIFWEKIINSTDNDLTNKLDEFIQSDVDRFMDYLFEFPGQAYKYITKTNKGLRREFWYSAIWEYVSFENNITWELIKLILDNEILTCPEDKDYFVTKLTNYVEKSIEISFIPREYMIPYLKDLNVFTSIKNKVFKNSQYNYYGINKMNTNWSKIYYLIDVIGIMDKEFIVTLHNQFTYPYPAKFGDFYDGLLELFHKNENFRIFFIETLKEKDISIDPRLIEKQQ